MKFKSVVGALFGANSILHKPVMGSVRTKNFWLAQVFRDGRLYDEWSWYNLVPTVGLNQLLDVTLGASTQNTAWYIGLIEGAAVTPTLAAGDTLASHAGWTENTNYTGNRKTWTKNAVASAGSITNSSAPGEFTIGSGGATIEGAFLCSASSGTTGVLYAAGTFTEKVLAQNDILKITGTFTTADDGV